MEVLHWVSAQDPCGHCLGLLLLSVYTGCSPSAQRGIVVEQEITKFRNLVEESLSSSFFPSLDFVALGSRELFWVKCCGSFLHRNDLPSSIHASPPCRTVPQPNLYAFVSSLSLRASILEILAQSSFLTQWTWGYHLC